MARNKTKSNRQTFEVEIRAIVTVDLDKSLLPDDEWRETFYGNIKTLEDLAKHLAYNRVANSIDSLTQLDGFADKDDSLAEFWDIEYDEAEILN